MDIRQAVTFSHFTTFRIGGAADFFVEIENENELKQALDFANQKNLPVLIIGGGSNLLVSDKGFRGLVIKVSIKGKEIINENNDQVVIKVGSGEIWDEVVSFAVSKNWWGIENLSGIPGFTGGVPVQNVGAYGQEALQVVENVEVLDLKTLEKKTISNKEAGFGYRKSNFNTIWKDKYAILSVSFRLSKSAKPNLEYADLKKYFESNPNPAQGQIRDAVIEIRKNKFPDINVMGCAGSCFKNFIVDEATYAKLEENIGKNFNQEALNKLRVLKQKFNGKIPAAFLIDICKLKGKAVGGAKLWDQQPLVIVNTGNAKASEVVELFNAVVAEVKSKTGMELQPEPEFIGI